MGSIASGEQDIQLEFMLILEPGRVEHIVVYAQLFAILLLVTAVRERIHFAT